MKHLLERLSDLGLEGREDAFLKLINEKTKTFVTHPKGNSLLYRTYVDRLPDRLPSSCDIDQDVIRIGNSQDMEAPERETLFQALKVLCPWRKGPFSFFGIPVESEWQSFIKWDRVKDAIGSLQNRTILDIGSSNGYYMFRMAHQNPRLILGLEPQHTFYFQYLAAQKYLGLDNVFCLPATFGELPPVSCCFDLVLCMGILSHRRNPLAMLKKIRELLRPGGKVVVENLVLDSRDDICLFPEDRYAKMRNIFFVPSTKTLESWLKRSGFDQVSLVDVSATTKDEQRKTDWIQTESLTDFLDPNNPGCTVEGYPAPTRATVVAGIR